MDNMDKLKRRLEIVNRVLAKYRIDPVSEQDVLQKWEAMNRDLAPGESHKSLNDFLHERKITLINRMIDLRFDRDKGESNPELTGRFLDWLDNGDCSEEKDAALLRRFEKLSAECERTRESADPEDDQRSLDDLWRRIGERGKLSDRASALPS